MIISYDESTMQSKQIHKMQQEWIYYKNENERLKTVITIAKYIIIVDILGLVISMFLLVK